MKTVNCEGIEYLFHESEGNAARWIMPLALYYCQSDKTKRGLDIGFSKIEWKMPNAIGIDPSYDGSGQHAMNIMDDIHGNKWDYIFSSHCLEHVKENWMNVLDYWLTKIEVGGILFLYLPHSSQRYWQPRNNRKHVHSFSGDEIGEYLKGLGHQTFVSGVDANHSFTVICEKKVISHKEAQEAFEKIYANESAPKFVAGWANIDAGNDMPSMQEYLQKNNIWPQNVTGENKETPTISLNDDAKDKIKQAYKSNTEVHHDFNTIAKDIYCPLDGGAYCKLFLSAANDKVARYAYLGVQLHGDTYKTGIKVLPEMWNYDFKATIEPMLEKIFMGISMVRINK